MSLSLPNDDRMLSQSASFPSSDASEADGFLDGTEAATLFLERDNHFFPVFGLAEDHFLIANAAQSVLPDLRPGSGDSSGLLDNCASTTLLARLATEDGDISIPIRFCADEEQPPLLRCRFVPLDQTASEDLEELLALINCTWEETQVEPGGEIATRALIVTNSNIDSPAAKLQLFKPTVYAVTGIGMLALALFYISQNREFEAKPDQIEPQQVAALVPVSPQSGVSTSENNIASLSDDSFSSQTATLESASLRQTVTGYVYPETSTIEAVDTGTIESLLVEVGQQVTVDQPVAVVKISPIENETNELTKQIAIIENAIEVNRQAIIALSKLDAEKKQLESQLARASLRLELVSAEYKSKSSDWSKIQPLLAKDNIPRKEAEKLKSEFDVAKKEYLDLEELVAALSAKIAANVTLNGSNQSEATLEGEISKRRSLSEQLTTLQSRLEESAETAELLEIRSPISGLVATIDVKEGSDVQRGHRMLEIQSGDSYRAEFEVDDRWASELTDGSDVLLRIADSDQYLHGRIEISKNAEPREPDLSSTKGSVVRIRVIVDKPSVDLPTGTLVVLKRDQ